MTKGKKNSGPRTQQVDNPVSDRGISQYLHRVYGFSPYSITELRELRKRIAGVLDRAMEGRERPRAADLVHTAPYRRYGFDAEGKRKAGSAASDMTTRARDIYLSPCPLTDPIFDWGHARRSKGKASLTRVFLWTSTIFEPSPSTVDSTSKAGWMRALTQDTAQFLQDGVFSMKTRRGHSLPIDALGACLGREKRQRRKRCIWPNDDVVEATVTESAPPDRPSLRLDLAEELATFFVDEPLFQLWDRRVWVIVAPHRAAVISGKNLKRHRPEWF